MPGSRKALHRRSAVEPFCMEIITMGSLEIEQRDKVMPDTATRGIAYFVSELRSVLILSPSLISQPMT